ncbi:hypothetical protein ACQ4PT_070966 [Festuca glaucescens]
MAPQEPEDKAKDRVPAGTTYTWIVENFAYCPIEANEDTVKTYTRVYMWYVISRTLFADSGGRTAQWMWLKALTVLEHKWSWGSAALAYLYRQLDDACRRVANDSGIGGPLLLLSVWSWEHLPIGRPRQYPSQPWNDHGNPLRYPTWAYRWDVVSEMTNDVNLIYKEYTNELDTLTPEQVNIAITSLTSMLYLETPHRCCSAMLKVEWQPYGGRDHFATSFDALNPKCLEEEYLWLMRCPLICNWAVEYHLPHRAMAQFGLFQTHPPEWEDTDRTLHRLDKKKQRKIKNWPDHHRNHVTKFKHCVEAAKLGPGSQLRAYCPIAFNNYVRWFISSTRVEICPPAYDDEILEAPICFYDVAENTYNRLVRQGSQTPFAPVLNFVRSEIKKHAEECEDAYETYPRGEKGESALREFIKRYGRRLRRLGNLLGCRDPKIATPSHSRSGSPPHPSPHLKDTTSANVEDSEVEDDMTLGAYTQNVRSAYMLKPRRGITRYTLDDYVNRGKKALVDSDDEPPKRSTLWRMRNDEEEDEPDPEVHRKIPPRRGRGPRTRGKK